jgi:hypothetical protein
MKIRAFFAIALAGLALSACAPRYYYDDRYGYDGRYYERSPYSRYDDRYYDPNGDQVRGRYYDWRDRY